MREGGIKTIILLCFLLCHFSSAKICDQYFTQQSCHYRIPTMNVSWCGGSLPAHAKVFGLIGDYGLASAYCESHVAALVKSFEQTVRPLEFIMTLGDNNYWSGHCSNMETHIGQYYGDYFTAGSACVDPRKKRVEKENRFFPTIGNHDWDTFSDAYDNVPYLQYFDYLKNFEPGIGKGVFYKKTVMNGLVDLFSLNSNMGKPEATSFQKQMHEAQMIWVKKALLSSNATFKIVYFHHPSYTTAKIDPPAPWMEANFTEWGASMVINGHEHVYERLQVNSIPYIINGLGGHPWRYTIHDCDIEPGSLVRYNDAHGALFAAVTPSNIEFCFCNLQNRLLPPPILHHSKNRSTRSLDGSQFHRMGSINGDQRTRTRLRKITSELNTLYHQRTRRASLEIHNP
eukprot:TRINITY_DN4134_c0_g1_i1.p1 TRINITY_DN4134_c0_g1~~TRINITY_DN4134_c0_g1_i1.p1  ORF type:complete len:399 (-),score=32.31 TRINITY_DN4134_c0_g1_i1:118-1314(-)